MGDDRRRLRPLRVRDASMAWSASRTAALLKRPTASIPHWGTCSSGGGHDIAVISPWATG